MYWQKLSTLFSSGGNARRSTLAGLAKKDASARLKAILDTDVNPEARPKFRPGLALYPIWTMRSDAAWWPMCWSLSLKRRKIASPIVIERSNRTQHFGSARLSLQTARQLYGQRKHVKRSCEFPTALVDCTCQQWFRSDVCCFNNSQTDYCIRSPQSVHVSKVLAASLLEKEKDRRRAAEPLTQLLACSSAKNLEP